MRGRRVIEKVEPTAFVGPQVKLGRNNYIGHYAVIEGEVTLGDNNHIGHHCVIGARAQNSVERYEIDDERDCKSGVFIGSNNVIREFSTVHLPMVGETRVADDCYLMAYTHVSHDTHIGSEVVLANNVQLGGHTHIERGANVGLSTVVHQYSTIGAYSMIGMGSVVSRDVPPFLLVMGAPADWGGKINTVGLARNGFSPEEIRCIEALYQNRDRFELRPLAERIRALCESFRQGSRRPTLDIGSAFRDWMDRSVETPSST